MNIRKENKKIRLKLAGSLNPVDVRNIIVKLKELKKNKKYREYRTLKIDLLSKIVVSSSISTEIKRDIKRFLRNE